MQKQKQVTLMRRVRTSNQGWTRRRVPVLRGKEKTKNWEERLDQTPRLYGEDVTDLGEYVIRWYEREGLRWKTCLKTVGYRHAEARAALEARLSRPSGAGDPLPEIPADEPSLVERLEPFLKERRAKKGIAPSTIEKYRNEVAEFLALTKVTVIGQVTEEVVAGYKIALEDAGYADNTRLSKFALVATFLRSESRELSLLLRDYAPKKTNKSPVSYSAEDIAALFAYLDRHNYKLGLILEMYFKTGLRERELTHLTWDVVDLVRGFLHVKGKREIKATDSQGVLREYVFRTKTRRDRRLPIPIEAGLLERLRRWRKEHPEDRFLFATARHRPETRLLEKLHAAVRNAGLQCGVCDACQSPCRNCRHCRCERCAHCRVEVNRNTHHRRVCLNARLGEKPCTQVKCQKWTLHRFRHSFATTALRNGIDIGMVQDFLGHASLATTQKYLGAATEAKTQDAINRAFAKQHG